MDGEEEQYVRLVSSDGFEFVISRKCAMVSGTIKSMLSGPGVCVCVCVCVVQSWGARNTTSARTLRARKLLEKGD